MDNIQLQAVKQTVHKSKKSQGTKQWIKVEIEIKLIISHRTEQVARIKNKLIQIFSFWLTTDQAKANRDNSANQTNPNSGAYKAGVDNKSNQQNPNNPVYSKK